MEFPYGQPRCKQNNLSAEDPFLLPSSHSIRDSLHVPVCIPLIPSTRPQSLSLGPLLFSCITFCCQLFLRISLPEAERRGRKSSLEVRLLDSQYKASKLPHAPKTNMFFISCTLIHQRIFVFSLSQLSKNPVFLISI